MEDDENKAKLKVNTVNEPIVDYGFFAEKRISVFTSFEQAAEAFDHEFYRNLTPEQRFEYPLRTKFKGSLVRLKTSLKRPI